MYAVHFALYPLCVHRAPQNGKSQIFNVQKYIEGESACGMENVGLKFFFSLIRKCNEVNGTFSDWKKKSNVGKLNIEAERHHHIAVYARMMIPIIQI